jgi:VCBS repeat protein
VQRRFEAPKWPTGRRFPLVCLLQALAGVGSGGCGGGAPGTVAASNAGGGTAAPVDSESALGGSGGDDPAVTGATGGNGGTSNEGLPGGIGVVGAERDSGAGAEMAEPVPALPVVSWETRTLSTLHTAEGADAGDIDGDGVIDLVAGPTWYKGPDFGVGGTLMAGPPSFSRDEYSTFFLTFVDDVDGDGRLDVLAIGDAGGGNGSGTPNAFWYRNPGPDQLEQAWVPTPLYAGLVANESPVYADVTGDGLRELVFMTGNDLGYGLILAGAGAGGTLGFAPISSGVSFANYTHGLGVGDVDGDGAADILERTGWWRQVPAGTWERHPFEFWSGATQGRSSNWGGSQMYVYDVDGDGDGDVVSGLAAHQYGLAWFESADLGATFVAHEILPRAAAAGNVSQLHSLAVADINGDGLPDLVAGKRYYAHPTNIADPGTDDPAIISWFELTRGPGGASFTQHVIDEDSGAGCNFVVRDLNGDGKVDVFTSNKRGTFLHLQR